MPVELEAMGTLTVHLRTSDTWRLTGPFGDRSCTDFDHIDWVSPLFTARSDWANGTFRGGVAVAEPQVQALFHTDIGDDFYLRYICRLDTESHLRGESPVFMCGSFEANDHGPLSWLNRTMIVGSGALDLDAQTQTFDVAVLR